MPVADAELPRASTAAPESERATFWREMLIAIIVGLGTLASGWSSYQSALWGGIQTFRLADSARVGREVAVKEVALGQQHLLDIFMLERFLEAREDGSTRSADFLLGRMSPELRAATRAWLQTRPGDNPDAARSPFHVKGYVQAGIGDLEAQRREQVAFHAAADQANKISDNYVRLTVFFGLSLFLAGVSAVMKGMWPRRALIGGGLVILMVTLVLLARMPLAAE